jgi:hypothetical protein
MGNFYRVVLNGSASGQDIKNILYYRVGLGVDMSLFDFAGAEALAGAVKDQVWSKMKNMLCNQYQLESIDVSPINDEFELVYQMPFSLGVNQAGPSVAPSSGVSACMNFKFVLEPTTILNGIKPPSRGYIAVGPIPASWIQEDGFLDPAFMAEPSVADFKAAISQNLEVLLPVPTVWFPIRMKQSRILGGLVHWESYADIKGCMLSRRASFRRSRMPEA